MVSGGRSCEPSARAFDCRSQPLRGVVRGESRAWHATDDDPQFLVEFNGPAEPGMYRFRAQVHASEGIEPCIYLDVGEGWSERACWKFERDTFGTGWSFCAWLPGLFGPARFDPMQFAGDFDFSGLVVERLGEGEALLSLLTRDVDTHPVDTAARLEKAAAVAATAGMEGCFRWLSGDRAPLAGVIDDERGYDEWIRRFDTLNDDDLALLRRSVAGLAARPLVTLLLTIGQDTEALELEATLADAVAQIYPDWELVVLDDGRASREAVRLVDGFVDANRRIRRVVLADDSSAPGPEHASGQFVALLEDCPRLRPHALLAMVDVLLASDDSLAGIHADHDVIDRQGRRSDPCFTPEWNPDLFRSRHYLGPLVLFEAALIRQALAQAPLQSSGAADLLALRCIALAGFESIARVPHVLAHRAYRDATDSAQTHTRAEQRAAELLQLSRADGVEISVDASDAGCHVHWPLPTLPPKVSLVIPTRDGLRLLSQCVDSILRLTTYPEYEIVIVDNQSSDPDTLAYFRSFDCDQRVRVLAYDAPFNYSALNNFAVSNVDGSIIGLVNNDIEVITPDWLEQMVQHALRPGIGAVGAMLYYPDDTIQHAGVTLGLGGVAGHPHSRLPRGTFGSYARARLVQDVSAVTAACLLLRREVFECVGGLDERLTVAFNDVDFCMRILQAGFRNLWTPLAELYHHESASRGSEDTPEKFARFKSEVDYMQQTWGELLLADRAYSPNLSIAHGDAFNLAFPSRAPLSSWVGSVND